MITVTDLSFHFGGQLLFKNVDLKFTNGNCYGIIGANGAGKSTFLKLLCGELSPSTGSIHIPADTRLSVLRQDHFAFDGETVLDTVIGGNERLFAVMKEKDALYMKEDFSDEDGIRAAELEAEFAEMNGWEAESDASRLVQGLGLSEGDNPASVERQLWEVLDTSRSSDFCHRLVHFGRDVCVARTPKCDKCPLFDLCDFKNK